MTTVYVSDDPEYTPAMTGKSVDADAYGRVWLATAPAVARKFGCRIEAILAARRSAEEWEHWNRNSEGGNDALAVEVWQAMHDEVDLALLGVSK